MDQWLLSPGAVYVADADISHIKRVLGVAFGVPEGEVWVGITGSAKLGFSISEKKQKDAPTLPRYRPFSRESDIDVAVISPPIFEKIWKDLSGHSHNAAHFPWRANRLGDYFVCGWLRPDHFPTAARLARCDLWWDTFRRLSTEPRFNRRSVRGGLFYSMDHLRSYMGRAIKECLAAEELV